MLINVIFVNKFKTSISSRNCQSMYLKDKHKTKYACEYLFTPILLSPNVLGKFSKIEKIETTNTKGDYFIYEIFK